MIHHQKSLTAIMLFMGKISALHDMCKKEKNMKCNQMKPIKKSLEVMSERVVCGVSDGCGKVFHMF